MSFRSVARNPCTLCTVTTPADFLAGPPRRWKAGHGRALAALWGFLAALRNDSVESVLVSGNGGSSGLDVLLSARPTIYLVLSFRSVARNPCTLCTVTTPADFLAGPPRRWKAGHGRALAAPWGFLACFGMTAFVTALMLRGTAVDRSVRPLIPYEASSSVMGLQGSFDFAMPSLREGMAALQDEGAVGTRAMGGRNAGWRRKVRAGKGRGQRKSADPGDPRFCGQRSR